MKARASAGTKKPRTKAREAPLTSRTDVYATESAMDLDYLLEPFFCELSDEAAAQIAEFLMQLALCFETTHLSQIKRHYETMRAGPTYDPNQLELFDPF